MCETRIILIVYIQAVTSFENFVKRILVKIYCMWDPQTPLWIAGFLDFGHCPVFWRTQRFGDWICFSPQVMGRETPTLLAPLERANLNHWTTCASITTAIYLRSGFVNGDNGKMYSISFLEYRKTDGVQNPNNPECHAPMSEPFRIYLPLCFSLRIAC
jgi:hypothetical protein